MQHENNHGLSEGSTTKMSKIYTHMASMEPKVKNPIMYKHLTKRNLKILKKILKEKPQEQYQNLLKPLFINLDLNLNNFMM